MHLAAVTAACLELSASPRVIFYMAPFCILLKFRKLNFSAKWGDLKEGREELPTTVKQLACHTIDARHSSTVDSRMAGTSQDSGMLGYLRGCICLATKAVAWWPGYGLLPVLGLASGQVQEKIRTLAV